MFMLTVKTAVSQHIFGCWYRWIIKQGEEFLHWHRLVEIEALHGITADRGKKINVFFSLHTLRNNLHADAFDQMDNRFQYFLIQIA